MIKICGVLLMLLSLYAFSETSNGWFAQVFWIGTFFYVSEALFSYAVNACSQDLIRSNKAQNTRASLFI